MPRRRASRSNTSMKVLPMARRFFSGSTSAGERREEVLGGVDEVRGARRVRATRAPRPRRGSRPCASGRCRCAAGGPARGRGRGARSFARDRRVDAARGEQEDRPVADLRAEPLDLLLDEALHRPGRAAAADAEDEVGEHLLAVQRVVDLGVELEAVAAQARPSRSRRSGAAARRARARCGRAPRSRGRRRPPSRSGSSRPARPGRARRRAGARGRSRRSAGPHSRPPCSTSPP